MPTSRARSTAKGEILADHPHREGVVVVPVAEHWEHVVGEEVGVRGRRDERLVQRLELESGS
jgi:hypothetical protein